MAEAVVTCLICENFLEFLKELAWCKQDDGVLVAVNNCTPEFIVVFGDHEVQVFPGGQHVKVNKSWLSRLQEMNEEGTPARILLVWREKGVELWYRRNNPADFPYDMWSNPVAEAYERERVFLPAEHGGSKFQEIRQEMIGKVKQCPTQIPKQ
jgi:hypothetical protein